MIQIDASADYVRATFKDNASGTVVYSVGANLTEAVENLVIRFKELQDEALKQLHERGFICVERTQKVEAS